MEDNEHELGPAFEKAVLSLTRQLQVIDGKILSVDKVAYTCDVQVGDSKGNTTYYNVTLRVLKNAQASIVEIPKVGTACTIYFADGHLGRPKLFMVHETDELQVNCRQVTFNKGQLGGMVKVQDTVTRLNNIENLLNTFFILFNTHTHNVTAVGSPTGPTIQQQTGTLTPTVVTDIENPLIKQ